MGIKLFLVVVGLTFSGLVQAAKYSATIQTESGGVECDARAARVAVIFQSQPNVDRVLAVDCLNEFQAVTTTGLYRVFTIAVDYEAKNPLEHSSAVFGINPMGSQSGTYEGYFKTLNDCIAARAQEVSTFEAQSGVSAPFVACLPDSSYLSEGYFLLIEGLGFAKKHLQAQSFYARSSARDDRLTPSQSAWLERSLVTLGANLRFNDGQQIFYYSDRAIVLDVSTFAWFKSLAPCKDQLSDVESVFTKASSSVLAECQQDGAVTKLSVLYMGNSFVSTRALSLNYSSYESCMKFKSAVAARESRDDPQHFLGLICVPDHSSASDFVHLKFTAY
jgi:hypothetical protein